MWILLAQAGMNIYLAAPVAVCFAVLIGVANGLLVSKGKVPAFIATFGMQNIVNSIALVLTLGSSIYFSHHVFRNVYESELLMIPAPIWIADVYKRQAQDRRSHSLKLPAGAYGRLS